MSSSMLINTSAYQCSTGTKKIRIFVAALIIVAAQPGCAFFPQSTNPTVDQKMTADVETRFGQHPELDAPNLLRVQTINRVVYLTGTVSTDLQRDYAESAADQAQGVAKVINSISVTN